jgi:hypothetical protein
MQKIEITIPDTLPVVILPPKEIGLGQPTKTTASPAPAVQIQITSAAETSACCAPGCCG